MSQVEVAGCAVDHVDDVFLAGEWVPGDGGRDRVVAPASGEFVADVALPSVEQALAAVAAAHEDGLARWGALEV